MPPTMMMMNALTTGSAPIVGLTAKTGASSPPAPPASAQPTPKPSAETDSMFTPCSAAASGVLRHRTHGPPGPAQPQEEIEARRSARWRRGHHQPLDATITSPNTRTIAGERRRHGLVEHAERELGRRPA